MPRIEKSVFISYRRTNLPWALNVYQNLTHHGYDVFFDYEGIGSGDFESIIVDNITSRAHFLILLTPSALERCGDPSDWLRREIEVALDTKRNIVPLMLEGFSFCTPSIANQLTGSLAPLKAYNGLTMPAEYFLAAMEKLRTRFLNVPLATVLQPANRIAQHVATEQKVAADAAPPVLEEELTAQQYFERGLASLDRDEQIRFYDEAIRLEPVFAEAYNNRGVARQEKGDLKGAARDYEEAIRLKPEYGKAHNNRGILRKAHGDLDGAITDYEKAIRFQPDDPDAYNNRGNLYNTEGDMGKALVDYNEAIRLKPDYAKAHSNRGALRRKMGDLEGAAADFDEAIRLNTDNPDAFYNRGMLLRQKLQYAPAIADLQRYLELGGGVRDGDSANVEQMMSELQEKLQAAATRN